MAKIKRKVGRPTMKVKDRKSKNFTIRFKGIEFQQLEKEAKMKKMSVADYLRYCWQKARAE